jgi:hypothetical protein
MPAALTSAHKNEILLFYTLLELNLIVVAGRVGGVLAKRRRGTARCRPTCSAGYWR